MNTRDESSRARALLDRPQGSPELGQLYPSSLQAQAPAAIHRCGMVPTQDKASTINVLLEAPLEASWPGLEVCAELSNVRCSVDMTESAK